MFVHIDCRTRRRRARRSVKRDPRPLWLRSHLGPSEDRGSVSSRVSQVFIFDLLIQVSATQHAVFFGVFHPFFTATDRTFEDAGQTTLPGSPTPLSSNFGSPKGSAPDLEKTGSRLGTMEKINEIYL